MPMIMELQACLCSSWSTHSTHQPVRLAAGKLHFVKFETSKLDQAVEFITAKGLHKVPGSAAQLVRVKATGGGAFKFTEVLQVCPPARACTLVQLRAPCMCLTPETMQRRCHAPDHGSKAAMRRPAAPHTMCVRRQQAHQQCWNPVLQ